MTKQVKITIKLFGKFEIEYAGHTIQIADYLPKKLQSLFELIILSENNDLNSQKACSELWTYNQNGVNALKYSIFRLRKTLSSIPALDSIDLVETGSCSYCLNHNYIYDIDILRFQQLYDSISDGQAIGADSFQAFCRLYQGPVYDSGCTCDEISSVSSICQKMFETISMKYLEQLSAENNQDELKHVLSFLPQKEPLSEELQLFYIRKLDEWFGRKTALEYCGYIQKKYKNTNSREIDRLLSAVCTENRSVPVRNNKIENYLEELNQYDTVDHYCCTEVFAYICRNHSVYFKSKIKEKYLILISLGNFSDNQDNHYKNAVKQAIRTVLHKNDVFTCYTDFCYLVLIKTDSQETAESAADRIIRQIQKRCALSDISYRIRKIASAD